MEIETPHININYIGYEEELAAQKAKIQKQNEEVKRKNEEFYKKMQNANKQKAEEVKAKNEILKSETITSEVKSNNQLTSTITTKENYNNYATMEMSFFLILVILIISLIIIVKKEKNKPNTTINNDLQQYNVNNLPINSFGANNSFYKKRCLTQTEFIFYKHLRKLIKEEYTIDPQVVLASIIGTKHNSNWFKINQKTVDFVIRDENFNTYIAIELDDPSHNREERRKRDIFVNAVFEDAGIPLIHIKTNNSYEDEIKIRIPEYLLKTEEK